MSHDVDTNDKGQFEELPDMRTIHRLRHDVTQRDARLFERDKVILEQQARISHQIPPGAIVITVAALETHDREVRIKCLEDAAGRAWASHCLTVYDLQSMANELKEQS